MEAEINKKLPFLDVLISYNNTSFDVSVYRKKTFTGLGMSFFSYCPLQFKINAIQTLVHRTFNICSNFKNIHNEFNFLTDFFQKNGFPCILVHKQIRKFLNLVCNPLPKPFIVPKKVLYIKLPYFGSASEKMKKEIHKQFSIFYKHINFKIILSNPLRISNLFKCKDKVPTPLRSSIVYKYKCPSCNAGSYIGSTIRCFQIRIDEHIGVSSRTGNHLSKPSHSSIREHCYNKHGLNPKSNDFVIVDCGQESEIRILESIHISKQKPDLNLTESAYPLCLL
jgi:hypothetical protein